MKKKIVLLSAFFFVFAASSAHAAIVHLKDGSSVRGTIVSATARDLQIHTSDGMQTIDTDRIQSVDYNDTESTPAPVPAPVPAPAPAEAPPQYRRRPPVEVYVPRRTDLVAGAQLFSIDFGFATPISRVDFSSTGGGNGDNGETGLLFGGQYNYLLSSKVGLGFDLEYMNRSGTSSENLLPDADTSVSGDSLLLLGTLKYSLVNHGGARPYLLVGAGANRTSTLIDAQPMPGFEWIPGHTTETRTLVDDARWGFASTARAGIDFLMADPAMFSLEFGWTGVSNSDYPATHAGEDLGLTHVSGRLNTLTFAARWGWRF